MTDYAAMPPGPEMDRLVAGLIGWDDFDAAFEAERKAERIELGNPEFDGDEETFRKVEERLRYPHFSMREDGLEIRLSTSAEWQAWSPSTNLLHVWEVVEYLKRRGFDLVLETLEMQYSVTFIGPVQRAQSQADGGHEGPYLYAERTIAPTAPLAICRAALIAMS